MYEDNTDFFGEDYPRRTMNSKIKEVYYSAKANIFTWQLWLRVVMFMPMLMLWALSELTIWLEANMPKLPN